MAPEVKNPEMRVGLSFQYGDLDISDSIPAVNGKDIADREDS